MKLIFSIFVLFILNSVSGQTLNYQWARGGGGSLNDTGQAITVDAKRYFVYVAGNYNSPSITLGSQTLNNNGGSDFFVAKYDTAGNLIWAKRFGGANSDWANGIECDTATGAVYVCGTYDISTQLGSFNLSAAGKNFYVLKLDQDGVPLWSKSGVNSGLSGGNNDYGNDISVLSNGDVVMVGMYNGSHGDTLIVDNFKLLYAPFGNPAGSAGDRLLLKLNSNGTVLNATLGGGIGLSLYPNVFPPNRRFLIEKDNQDNIYVATNKMGNEQNAGLDCGGVLSGASQVGLYLRNYTVYQLSNNLVQTAMICRQSLAPHPGCTITTGYSTEMTDMTRDLNGNIFVSFKYIVNEGPSSISPTCSSSGNGIKRIITPGNTGTDIEKFRTPGGKIAAYNNLLLLYDTGPASGGNLSSDSIFLYDFETQTILQKIPATIKAQDLVALPLTSKIFVTGLYNTNATVGANVMPTLPGDNIVVAAHSTCQGTLPPVPVISAGGPTSFCNGGSVVLTASTASNYLWSNGATTQSITVTTSGNYTVSVFNTSGCSSTSNATAVTVFSSPTATITASGPITFCQGGSVNLSAPAGFSYLWSNGSTSQTVNVNATGNYSVTVTNANGCSATSAITSVTVNPLPAIPVIAASGPTSFCTGGSVTLTAPAGFTYLWNTGSTTQSINVNTSGNYAVTVTNANGCSRTSSVTTVTVNSLPPVPTITASGPTTFCSGGSVTLSAPAGFTYLWSNGSTTQSINVTSAGNYAVTVTNASGCSSSSPSTTVTVNPLPATPVITASGPTTFCAGGSVTLTAPAGFTYLWSNGATTQSINVNTSGSYNVRVTNANNCSATSLNTTVTVNPLPAVPVISQSGNTLSTTAASAYQWYYFGAIIPGATSQSYTYTTGGEFTVTVTNAQGCTSTSAPYTAMRNAFVDIGSSERFYFSLFPNPVTAGQLSIRYQTEQSHMVGIRLVDINGNSIVIQQPVMRSTGIYTVNANAVAERIWSGVYILEFTIDSKRVTRTIIKF